MLYEILVALFIFLCFFLMVLILVQKSKGSIGIGNLGGSMQMLFGGSGGQSLFQKATWVVGALFMGLSLILAIMKTRGGATHLFEKSSKSAPIETPVETSKPAPVNQEQQKAPAQQP